jgi:uncharacterized membrane protein
MKRTLLAVSAVILALLGCIGGFFGMMFRMDPGEESAAVTHDVIVGVLIGGACSLGVLALPASFFRTARTRLRLAVIPSAAFVVLLPALLFYWQWSILEARRHRAQRHIESRTSEPGGPANGSQPIRSGTNQTSSAAGSRR